MSEIRKLPDEAALAEAAAEHITALAKTVTADKGRFSIALSGGSTPVKLYELLASDAYSEQIDWPSVHIFWGDERCVPPDHVDSCYKMARDTLLDYVPIPEQNVHRMLGEIRPDEAAARYEHELKRFFGETELFPRFDLILLGMGDDGHTASLFPGTNALLEEKRCVIENYVPAKQMWRITLTRPTINAAANVIFLAAGAGKAIRLQQVLRGDYNQDGLPAQLVQPKNGIVTWFVDQAAASRL
jgi:6-phosphogluconolactonase